MKKLSIIIVNYRVKFFLEQALLSVRAAASYIDTEIFVIDNNSQDDSIEYLRPRFPEVHFIENLDNAGFAKANNQAIALTRGEYILLLNPDTVIGENTLKDVCDFMDSHPDAGGLGVKMLDGEGYFLPESKRGFPTPWVSFCKIFGLSGLFPGSRHFGRYHMRYLDENKTHRIDILAGAFMLMRHKALDKSGWLDEAFFMYGEDIDLSYRLTLAGFHNYYLPVRIIHYKGESTHKDSLRYVKIFYEAMLIFFRKHYPHYSKIYFLTVKTAIFLRAIMAASCRIMSYPFRKFKNQGTGDKYDSWHIISNHPEKIAAVIRKHKNGPIREWKKISEALRSDSLKIKMIHHFVFDSSTLSYGDIIREMENLHAPERRFHIYSPESGAIISPNETLT